MADSDTGSAEETAEWFLGLLGQRVRAARARHGMTRRDLATHSGVSERHLAQVEAGKGNISVVLLRQIARALATPVALLLDDREAASPERRMLGALLDQLPQTDLAEARRMIEARFMRPDDRFRRLALVGLRGAGKSSVGRLLAERHGIAFVELAEDIETLGGMGLNEIFEMSGQAGYRRLEREALSRRVDSGESFIMATGGGIVSDPVTYQMLLANCFTVWLRADPEAHMDRVVAQGDRRPMAGNRQAMQDLRRILETREPLYAQADLSIDTSASTPEATAREIAAAWSERQGFREAS
jgi:XRE family aerobic/anaerobic benzoate catabolism transcriptional regulator